MMYQVENITLTTTGRSSPSDRLSSGPTELGLVSKAKIQTIRWEDSLKYFNIFLLLFSFSSVVRVTGVLVVGFIICWTPYNVMSLWWWIDRGTAAQTDYRLQKVLWTAAAMNNCINPLFYRMSFNGRWEGSIKGAIREYLGESFCKNILQRFIVEIFEEVLFFPGRLHSD